MKVARNANEFIARPIGRVMIGSTFVLWCAARDLAGSIHWGAPNDRDVREMVHLLEFLRHPELAARGRVLMDCRYVERADGDVMLGFMALARERLDLWSQRIDRQVVIVPDGIIGMLLAAPLPLLAPSYAFRFVRELEMALACVEHPDASTAHGAAMAHADAARGQVAVLDRFRAQLAHDSFAPTVGSCALALGLSPRSLQRELHRLGTSFSDELRRARVGNAEQLLVLSDMKLEAIAVRVGFGTASRMSAALRRERAVTAGQLRARVRAA